MNALLELGGLVILALLLVSGLAVWRIGRVVPWRALLKTAWITRCFGDCVAFIRFCVDEREHMAATRPHGQQRIRPQVSTTRP